MIPALAPLLGWVKSLKDNWTPARAAKIDNLDAAISTTAPANTALSVVDWSAARAAKLDNLDVLLSSRLSSAIKSIQNVSVPVSFSAQNSKTGTATIAAVNTAKSIIIARNLLASANGFGLEDGDWSISSSVQVSVYLHFYSAITTTINFKVTVVEFY